MYATIVKYNSRYACKCLLTFYFLNIMYDIHRRSTF